jgi:hypothetical protein
MGAEAMCTAEFNGQRSQGKALLETDYVLFRGDFRLKIPFSDIQKIAADDSHLTIQFAGGDAKFDLGPTSRKWMQKIQHPPSLFDKLGVKAGLRIALSGVEDEEFSASLRSLAGTFVKKEADIVFVGIESKDELPKIEKAATAIQPAGAVWVVYPKGRKDIKESEVMAAAKAAGLVDVKVCAFSPTHTATKMVIPVAKR